MKRSRLIQHQILVTNIQGNLYSYRGELTIRSWGIKGFKLQDLNTLNVIFKDTGKVKGLRQLLNDKKGHKTYFLRWKIPHG